jgi:hypothetical protein
MGIGVVDEAVLGIGHGQVSFPKRDLILRRAKLQAQRRGGGVDFKIWQRRQNRSRRFIGIIPPDQ